MLASTLSTINFLTLITSNLALGGLIITSFMKYKKMKYQPFLYLIVSFIALIISNCIDLVFRFSVSFVEERIRTFLSIGGVLFYFGSLMIVFIFFTVQRRIWWMRLLMYGIFYGLMIQIHLSSEFFIYFDPVVEMWFTDFNSSNFAIVDILTMIPAVDLMILILRRHRKGFTTRKAKVAISLFWFGILFPIAFYLIPFSNPSFGVVFSNIILSFSFILIGLAFLVQPLVFILSTSELHEIFLIRTDIGNIPVAIYSWIRNHHESNIVAQVYAGIGITLNSFGSDNPEKVKKTIKMMDLGEKMVIIEHSEHFSAYLIGKHLDKVTRIAIRKLLSIYEQRCRDDDGIEKHLCVEKNIFRQDIENVFNYVQSS